MPYPEVKFAIRYPAGQGAWRYEPVDIPHPGGVFMPLEYLPSAGDLVTLWDRSGTLSGGPHFKVVQRSWTWSGYGSVDWPYGKAAAESGPLVDIIVEPATGPYSDEAPICAEPDCSAMWIDRVWVIRHPADQEGVEEHEHRIYVSDPTKPL
jgi:hypothetical protein